MRDESSFFMVFYFEELIKSSYVCTSVFSMFCAFLNLMDFQELFVNFDSFQMLLTTLLPNGFSLFLNENAGSVDLHAAHLLADAFENLVMQRCYEAQGKGFFSLILEIFRFEHLEDNISICRQLLALGYGRRELHPKGVFLHDKNLEAFRRIISEMQESADFVRHQKQLVLDSGQVLSENDDSMIALGLQALQELQMLVNAFDAGPLSLLKLSRIAVRRAIVGVHFARHIKALSPILPPLLYNYLSDPTEFLHMDCETPAKRSKFSKYYHFFILLMSIVNCLVDFNLHFKF